jgi:hypothetical protein
MIFDFIGEQTVKNLTDPICVYRVRFPTSNHHIRNSLVRLAIQFEPSRSCRIWGRAV